MKKKKPARRSWFNLWMFRSCQKQSAKPGQQYVPKNTFKILPMAIQFWMCTLRFKTVGLKPT